MCPVVPKRGWIRDQADRLTGEMGGSELMRDAAPVLLHRKSLSRQRSLRSKARESFAQNFSEV